MGQLRGLSLFEQSNQDDQTRMRGEPHSAKMRSMSEGREPVITEPAQNEPAKVETAYFATGCFWGAERRFWQMPGVIETSVGYMGGRRENPSYEQVCTGVTGHAEVVMVKFDPDIVSYERLLAEFWMMHDPTSLNRQGNDIGTQYRSAIFTTSTAQGEMAKRSRDHYQDALQREGIGAIVTEISDASDHPYWLAEEYHQKYLMKNPNGYDCHSSTGVAYPMMDVKRANA